MSQNLFFVIILCVCTGAALDMRRKRCTHLASHNGFSTDYHIVWPAPWSGNAIAVSGRGCGGLRVTLARHILDTHFLRGLNAERGWCARPHVCRARRRLAGGIGREETLFIGGSLFFDTVSIQFDTNSHFKIFFDCRSADCRDADCHSNNKRFINQQSAE